jgi:hypothetical protein
MQVPISFDLKQIKLAFVVDCLDRTRSLRREKHFFR